MDLSAPITWLMGLRGDQMLMALLVASGLMALLEMPFGNLLLHLFKLPGDLLGEAYRALSTVAVQLGAACRHVLDQIVAPPAQPRDESAPRAPRPWVGWYVIGALIYLVFAVLLVVTDLMLAIDFFAAIKMIPAEHQLVLTNILGIPVGAGQAILVACLLAFFGLVWLDLKGASRTACMWEDVDAETRERCKAFARYCMVGSLTLAALMGLKQAALLFGGLPEPYDSLLTTVIRVLIVVLTFAGTGFAIVPLAMQFGVLGAIGLFFGWLSSKLLAWAARVTVLFLRVLGRVILFAWQLLAFPFKFIANLIKPGVLPDFAWPSGKEDIGGDLDFDPTQLRTAPTEQSNTAGSPTVQQPATGGENGRVDHGAHPVSAAAETAPAPVAEAVRRSPDAGGDARAPRPTSDAGMPPDVVTVAGNGAAPATPRDGSNAADRTLTAGDDTPLPRRDEDGAAPVVAGRKRCWNCGTEVVESANFCTNCREHVSQVCPNPPCRYSVQPGSSFCANCGLPLPRPKADVVGEAAEVLRQAEDRGQRGTAPSHSSSAAEPGAPA